MSGRIEQKSRINYYDIAKGIGIILVVLAHGEGVFMGHIYQFHMPLFFLISGLLYSNKSSVKDFVKRKFYSLYIPFVFWNLFFHLFISIYTSADIKSVIIKSFRIIFTLDKDGQFLGATWFLGALFVISVLYKILDYFLRNSKQNDFILLLVFLIFSIFGFIVTLPYHISRTLILGAFYSIGALYKKRKNNIDLLDNKYRMLALFSFIIFMIIGYFNRCDMGQNEYKYPVLFFIGAVMASYSLIYFCKLLDNSKAKVIMTIKRVLIYLGKRSIDIVIWQFVAFRIVIITQMILNNEEITIHNILAYNNLYSGNNGWWIVYTIVGIIVPLLWCNFLRLGLWGKILKRIHAV